MTLPTTRAKPQIPNPGGLRVLIYGAPKVGKSTWAAQWPDALHIDTQGGALYLDTYRHPVSDWAGFCAAVKELRGSKYKAVIVDTMNDLYDFAFAANPVQRGSKSAVQQWARLNEAVAVQVQALCQSGIGVVFVCHEKIVELTPEGRKVGFIERVDGPTVLRFRPSLPDGVYRVLNAAVDVIARAWVHDGRHVLQCQPTDAIEAGDRTGILPAQVPLTWDGWRGPFAAAYKRGQG